MQQSKGQYLEPVEEKSMGLVEQKKAEAPLQTSQQDQDRFEKSKAVPTKTAKQPTQDDRADARGLPRDFYVQSQKRISALEMELAEQKKELAKEKEIKAEPVKDTGLVKKAESYLEAVEEKPEIKEVKKGEKAEKAVEKENGPAPTPQSIQVRKQIKQLQGLGRENQIKALSDLAFQKSPDFAIKTAKGLNDAYVLDEFHKVLTGELQRKLMEKGELKKL